MTRLKALNPEQAEGKTKNLFDSIQSKMGLVPNMMRTMGNSPALLEGTLLLSNAMGNGLLGAKTAELIALAVAESNGCKYCLGAHTFVGASVFKMDAKTLNEARKGNGADTKTDAILKFAKALVNKQGQVNDADVHSIKSAGVSEAEICEVIGHVALNILTNYFNTTALTEPDFPEVEAVAV
ncbi:MAG TPA: carboxymuconolactone decarboxylase family protein [Bacteroidia bacterium]|nr:carboxymuconolactone decarboxylase family protein [Bacteroidia bacterium]